MPRNPAIRDSAEFMSNFLARAVGEPKEITRGVFQPRCILSSAP